jgi:hypothetical protein
MKHFIKYAGLCVAIQGLLWALLLIASFYLTPALDSLVEKILYIYYPTIALVERYGNFKGEANIIRPILIGVSLGIFVYGIIFGLFCSFIKRAKLPN